MKLALAGLFLLAALATAAAEDGLAARLRALAEAHGFVLVGADRLSPEAPRTAPGGDVEAEVRALLAGHNHVIRRGSDGAIAKLVILGAKPAPETVPRGIVVATRRRGAHHEVTARLAGPDGRTHELALIVDTGASTVVLPASWIDRLGFAPDALRPGRAATAGGTVETWIGELPSLSIGRARRRDVVVSFIDDAQLGDKALLGMSFLEAYRFEFDRTANRLVLFAR